MAPAGFAEQHGLDRTTGAQSFFHQADAFDTDEPGFSRQAATQGQAKLLQPAVVAAGNRGGSSGSSRSASGFARRGHVKGSVANFAAQRLISPLVLHRRILGHSHPLRLKVGGHSLWRSGANSCLHETRVPTTCDRESGGKTAALHIAWACRGVVASCGMPAPFTRCAPTARPGSSRANSRPSGLTAMAHATTAHGLLA